MVLLEWLAAKIAITATTLPSSTGTAAAYRSGVEKLLATGPNSNAASELSTACAWAKTQPEIRSPIGTRRPSMADATTPEQATTPTSFVSGLGRYSARLVAGTTRLRWRKRTSLRRRGMSRAGGLA